MNTPIARITRSDDFVKDYNNLPKPIQKQLDSKMRFLVQNPRHPSLQIKKVKGELKGHRNIFEGRITKNYRFIFRTAHDSYELLHCGTHTQIFGR